MISRLQQTSLLRIHTGSLSWRDREKRCIKSCNVFLKEVGFLNINLEARQQQYTKFGEKVLATDCTSSFLVWMVESIQVVAVTRHSTQGRTARLQHLVESFRSRCISRELEIQANDGDSRAHVHLSEGFCWIMWQRMMSKY